MATIERHLFGELEGRMVYLFTLTNKSGMKVEILSYGGVIKSIYTPDRSGKLADVVLGFDTLEDYLKKSPFFGTLVGRYANRIAGASFDLNGKNYPLVASEGKNQLHGGTKGFDKKNWDAVIIPGKDGEQLALSYFSKDGEEGFPGNLETTVIYSLSEDNKLGIEYIAVSDQDTVINLTNHSYFNLAGHSSGNVLSQELQMNSDFYTEIGEGSIPTGALLPVEGTPFNFKKSKTLGEEIGNTHPQLRLTDGYDHNFVINESAKLPNSFAVAYDPDSGRTMEVATDKPGVQLYTGNFLTSDIVGKEGITYCKHAGFCLETQFYPDSLHQPSFPSAVLPAYTKYRFTTKYVFGIR